MLFLASCWCYCCLAQQEDSYSQFFQCKKSAASRRIVFFFPTKIAKPSRFRFPDGKFPDPPVPQKIVFFKRFPDFPPVEAYFHICTDSCLYTHQYIYFSRSPSRSSDCRAAVEQQWREQPGRGAEADKKRGISGAGGVIYPRGHGKYKVRRGPDDPSVRRRLVDLPVQHSSNERMECPRSAGAYSHLHALDADSPRTNAPTKDEESMMRSACDASVGWKPRPCLFCWAGTARHALWA